MTKYAKENKMTKYAQKLFLSIILTLLTFHSAFCQDITLSWDASPSSNVSGYYVYYKHNSTTLPFDGVGAIEGPSPVDVGDNLSATLTGLSDSGTFYFTVTAYDANRVESSNSNIVSNAWMPELLTPADNATDEPVPATFQWTTEPTGAPLNYTLYYGTDSSLVSAAGSLPNSYPITPVPDGNLITLYLLALLLLVYIQNSAKQKVKLAAGILATCLVLSACGGGGGGGDSSSSKSSTDSTDTTVFSIDKGSSDYHQAFDLQPGTTYYWKVVGVDTTSPSLSHSSTVASFTTEAF
jgi:hypothetical protein